MKKLLMKTIINAMNSWVTSLGGSVIGLGAAWAGVRNMIDGDPATEGSWMLAIGGLIGVIVSFITRDHTKGIASPRSK